MSGGIDLSTNDNDLLVDGLVQLTGGGTSLFVGGATSELNADNLTTGGGGTVELDGGALVLNEEQLGLAGAMTINAGGTLAGHGTVTFADSPIFSASLLSNNGTISAFTRVAIIGQSPPANTLSISGGGLLARIDLDGTSENGVVNINRNQTLEVNLAISDAFHGDMNMFQGSTLEMGNIWTLGDGTIDVDNGATGGIPAVPAGVSTIAGGALTQSAGTITVVDNDGTLEFDAPFTMNGGNFINNGLVVFDANATIAAGANFTMPTTASRITVAANRTVSINANNFNMDGSNALTNVITVETSGTLNITTTDYDPEAATNAFDGTININSGSISVNTSDAEFVMDGTLNMNKSGAPVAEWEGSDQLDIGNDAGALDANLNIGGNGNSLFHSQVDFNADADVDVAAGCGLILNFTTNFNTVNGVNNAQFTGSGYIRFNGQINFNEAVTFSMTGGTVDFDGLDTANGDTVNVDAPVTVNAATMDSFGKDNTAGVNTLDINNNVGTGVLTVNLDNAAAEWTLNAQGAMNLVNDSTEATLLAGNDININGTLNVTGDVRSTARLDFGSTAAVTINTAGQPLRLGGGNAGPDVNTISGGTIGGAGLLGADAGKGLHGFGTIGADIDFDGTANLHAAGGTLTIAGDIVDVNILGTADASGTLNVVNAWETDGGAGGSIGAVVLAGGVLQGGQITNDNVNGLQGHGTITSRVINNSKIVATNGGTLIVQTSGNNNDWDGAANTGDLEALSGDLEMVDTTMPVPPVRPFGGTVRAINDNRVFANGFALDFSPTSSLELEDEAIYRASSSTDIGGTVTIGAGADATIQVANNYFLTFETGSTTTLGGDLTLINNNINIEQGAVFSGAGALNIPDGSHMVADNQADIGVLLNMDGAFRPGNFNGIGRVDLLDYQQADTGELYVELVGTALNAFDRLVADGDVVLDGYLNIDIDEVSPGVPFVPSLGQTFNIITGNTVTGHFDYADISGMPDGLTFHVSYLPNAVQLQVVNTPYFSADFDDDGDVDATDLAIWRNAFDLNQLGDADGDNDSDGEDFLIWQQQFGSIPGAGAALGATVPEPASALMLVTGLVAAIAFCGKRCRARHMAVRESGMCKAGALSSIVCVVLFLTHSEVSYGQTIDISLNLQYTMPSEPAMGGNWMLVAKTNSINGIGSISAILSNVDAAGIAYQSGIGAMLKDGSPFVADNGSLVELLYAQDVSNPASVVTDVGRGTGTPGNLVMDPFGDPYWNNAAVIATGTFGDTRPEFTANLDTPPDVTKGNVLATKTAPFFMTAAATVTTIVRDGLYVPLVGDYNLNGTVDAADYVIWRDTLGSPVTPSSGADGDGDGMIGSGDYDVWRAHFGATAGSGAAAVISSLSGNSVPEPAAWLLCCFAAAAIAALRRR
jgi:hypothetical protein